MKQPRPCLARRLPGNKGGPGLWIPARRDSGVGSRGCGAAMHDAWQFLLSRKIDVDSLFGKRLTAKRRYASYAVLCRSAQLLTWCMKPSLGRQVIEQKVTKETKGGPIADSSPLLLVP